MESLSQVHQLVQKRRAQHEHRLRREQRLVEVAQSIIKDRDAKLAPPIVDRQRLCAELTEEENAALLLSLRRGEDLPSENFASAPDQEFLDTQHCDAWRATLTEALERLVQRSEAHCANMMSHSRTIELADTISANARRIQRCEALERDIRALQDEVHALECLPLVSPIDALLGSLVNDAMLELYDVADRDQRAAKWSAARATSLSRRDRLIALLTSLNSSVADVWAPAATLQDEVEPMLIASRINPQLFGCK